MVKILKNAVGRLVAAFFFKTVSHVSVMAFPEDGKGMGTVRYCNIHGHGVTSGRVLND